MATNYQIGDKIQNRWEIHKIFGGPGKSGMGIVYIVYDHKLCEVFAAKTFQDEIFARNPAIADRFTQEARAWISLDIHQNVTRAHLVEKIDGKPFLFLEYVSGGDLNKWIGTPRLTKDMPQVLYFAIQFCDGMIHALSKGIKAHRDLKPENCLITEDGILKVTDFGLAKIFDDAGEIEQEKEKTEERVNPSVGLTHTGAGAGTPTHMAPEQFEDAKHVDVRADLYAFGVLLYQMVTGQLPFVGRTWDDLERLHKTAPPPPLNSYHPQLSALVETCLAKDRLQRFASFDIVRQRLAEIYEKLTGRLAPKQVIGKELDAWQWSNKGVCLGNLDMDEAALSCYDVALQINPRFEPAWYNRGSTLTRIGRYEEAVISCNRAIEINPDSHAAWSDKGAALWHLGRNEEALACCDRALELNPNYARAWTNKGITLKTLGKLEESLAYCEHAVQLNPRLDLAWFNHAAALQELDRHEAALASYDIALEINPRLEHAWHNKGQILYKLGRYKEAISCYDLAIKLAPRFEPAWCNKGLVLEEMKRFEEALACYDHAIKLDPQDKTVLVNKGTLLGKLGRYDDALVHYNRSIELDSKFAESWYNKGTLLATLREYDQAIICFDHVLAANPQDDQALVNKSAVLQLQQRYKESLDCCETAITINNRSHIAWYNKGFALYNLQKFSDALTCFKEAQSLGNPQAALAIGMCRRMLDQSGK